MQRGQGRGANPGRYWQTQATGAYSNSPQRHSGYSQQQPGYSQQPPAYSQPQAAYGQQSQVLRPGQYQQGSPPALGYAYQRQQAPLYQQQQQQQQQQGSGMSDPYYHYSQSWESDLEVEVPSNHSQQSLDGHRRPPTRPQDPQGLYEFIHQREGELGGPQHPSQPQPDHYYERARDVLNDFDNRYNSSQRQSGGPYRTVLQCQTRSSNNSRDRIGGERRSSRR